MSGAEARGEGTGDSIGRGRGPAEKLTLEGAHEALAGPAQSSEEHREADPWGPDDEGKKNTRGEPE